MTKENISSLVDGELQDSDAQRCISLLRDDREARENWETCQLIGDVLRGHVTPGFTEKVRARLESEPALLVPWTRAWNTERVLRMAMSAAASVAAVALVSWLVLGGNAPEQQVARGPGGAQTQARAETAVQPVTDYLLAHQRYSSSSAVQGVAPFVRTVAAQSGDGQ